MINPTFFMCLTTSLLTFYSIANEPTTVDTASVDKTQAKKAYLSQNLHGGFTIGARVGGNSYLYFSPFIGVTIGKFQPAVGLSFSQYIQNSPYLKEERLGIRGLVRYQIYKTLFTSLEYDGQKNSIPTETGFKRQWTNNVLLGLGIAVPITEDSQVTFEFLYQLNYRPGHSPYGHKQMLGRIGVAF